MRWWRSGSRRSLVRLQRSLLERSGGNLQGARQPAVVGCVRLESKRASEKARRRLATPSSGNGGTAGRSLLNKLALPNLQGCVTWCRCR